MEKRAVIELSSFHHGVIGAAVGSIEQSIMRPSVFWKAELQQNRFDLKRALNPRFCYRGLPVAVMSIAPITCIQFSVTNATAKTIKLMRGSASTSDLDKFASGVIAGMASAMVQSPFQLVEVNQQNHGGNMVSTARRVVSTYGIRGLYRGGSMTAVREGIFCSSYMAVAPFVKGQVLERHPDMSDGVAVAVSSIISGGLGGLMSHPADTLKTRLQGSLFTFSDGHAASKASGPREALEELRRQGPLMPQLYRGFTPRGFRLVCCTYIYSSLTTVFEDIARNSLCYFDRFGVSTVVYEPLQDPVTDARRAAEDLGSLR
jgi:hypothetical protein